MSARETPVAVDEAESAPTMGPVIDVAVTDDGRRALMTVHAGAPGGAGSAADAAAALAAAGVVHGIDDAAVHAALAAADGVARPVAHASPPVPPTDAVITITHAEHLDADPLFSVPAGTTVARREPPRPGIAGTDVTGHPIEPREPRVPPMEAGPGVRIDEAEGGALHAHAVDDGRPVLTGRRISVETAVRTPQIAAGATHDVCGTLVVLGDVAEASRVAASGSVIVGGLVAHAHVDGEAGVAVCGACLGAHIRAGARGAACRRVHSELSGALDRLELLAAATAQLVAGSAGTARPISEAAALRILVERRFTELPACWAAAAGVVAADGEAALMSREGTKALAGLAAALADPPAHGVPSLDALARVRAALAPDMARLQAMSPVAAEVRAAYLQACRVEASGGLTVTGSGTYNTDAVIGGDLDARAPGSTVRGGGFQVGGAVRVAELGAPGEARVVIDLTGPPRTGLRLSAAVAHPGVEITLAGHRVRIERTTLNLAVGCDEEMRVVRSGDIVG